MYDISGNVSGSITKQIKQYSDENAEVDEWSDERRQNKE